MSLGTSKRSEITMSARDRPSPTRSSSRWARRVRIPSGLTPRACQQSPARATRRRAGGRLPPTAICTRRCCHGLGAALTGSEREEAAVEGGLVVVPERPQHGEELVGVGTSLAVGHHAHGVVLLGEGADADAAPHPPLRELVERGERLGQDERVEVGDDEHARAQLDARRGRRRPREDGQRVVVRPPVQTVADVADVEQVVVDPDRVIAGVLGPAGQIDDAGDVVDSPVVGQDEPEAHGDSVPGFGRRAGA